MVSKLAANAGIREIEKIVYLDRLALCFSNQLCVKYATAWSFVGAQRDAEASNM